MAILGTPVALAASHHPQTDGQTERTIQTLTRLFRCFAEEQKEEWEKLLPFSSSRLTMRTAMPPAARRSASCSVVTRHHPSVL